MSQSEEGSSCFWNNNKTTAKLHSPTCKHLSIFSSAYLLPPFSLLLSVTVTHSKHYKFTTSQRAINPSPALQHSLTKPFLDVGRRLALKSLYRASRVLDSTLLSCPTASNVKLPFCHFTGSREKPPTLRRAHQGAQTSQHGL